MDIIHVPVEIVFVPDQMIPTCPERVEGNDGAKAYLVVACVVGRLTIPNDSDVPRNVG